MEIENPREFVKKRYKQKSKCNICKDNSKHISKEEEKLKDMGLTDEQIISLIELDDYINVLF